MKALATARTTQKQCRQRAMTKMQKQLALIASLLRDQTTLSLATSGEDSDPALAPLFYIAGNDLDLYWFSSPASRHSFNLIRSPRVAVAVYRPAAAWREIRGVQMRGLASIVVEPERRAALLKAYSERFRLGRVLRAALRISTLYRFQPEFIRYIDNASGFGSRFELTRLHDGWSHTRHSE
jgi:uncharacterized protein YhbP (UPF0306 family)